MISSPLEQFHLIPILPIKLGSFDFTITHSTLMMYIGLFAFLTLLRMLIMDKGGYIVPNRWQVFVEQTY